MTCKPPVWAFFIWGLVKSSIHSIVLCTKRMRRLQLCRNVCFQYQGQLKGMWYWTLHWIPLLALTQILALSECSFSQNLKNLFQITDIHWVLACMHAFSFSLSPQLVCVHKMVLSCWECKHSTKHFFFFFFFYMSDKGSRHLFVKPARHSHSQTQTTQAIYKRLTHQVKNAARVVFILRSTTQKHYKSHKPLTVLHSKGVPGFA